MATMTTWGSWIRPRDASGRESRTLAFVGMTWLLLVARFAFGGLTVAWGPVRFEIAQTPMVDFGAAVASVLTIWVGREWVRKKGEKPDD